MRIQIQRDGGFGYFPGLGMPVTVDTSTLPPDEAELLERLVRQADIAQHGASVAAPPAGAADIRSYTITVDDGVVSESVTVTEPVGDAALQSLIDRVLDSAR
jgi:emfourin